MTPDLNAKVAALQALVDAKFTPAQHARLEEAKTALREFARAYGPYAAIALTVVGSETTAALLESFEAFVARRAAASLPEGEVQRG